MIPLLKNESHEPTSIPVVLTLAIVVCLLFDDLDDPNFSSLRNEAAPKIIAATTAIATVHPNFSFILAFVPNCFVSTKAFEELVDLAERGWCLSGCAGGAEGREGDHREDGASFAFSSEFIPHR